MAVLNFNKKYFPNIEWAASKPLGEFIAHEAHTGLSVDELTEAHGLCVAAAKPAPVAEATAGKKANKEADK